MHHLHNPTDHLHHHHHHPAGHSHDHDSESAAHSHNFAEANITYFNQEFAKKLDVHPDAIEVAHKVGEAVLKAYPFDEDSTTVLDYACGTGLVSRELAPYIKSIVGVDISQAMVDQYNVRVGNQGIPPEEMKAVCVNLQGQEGELDGAKFDVVVCASAYHHFASIEDVTRILAFFLRPGGVLLVTDIARMDTGAPIYPDNAAHVVPHRTGFTKEDFQKVFTGAALELVSFETIAKVKHHGNDVDFFLVKGIKPTAS